MVASIETSAHLLVPVPPFAPSDVKLPLPGPVLDHLEHDFGVRRVQYPQVLTPEHVTITYLGQGRSCLCKGDDGTHHMALQEGINGIIHLRCIDK
jgi:hypothetical protein